MKPLSLAACLLCVGLAAGNAHAEKACPRPLSLAFYEFGALYHQAPDGTAAGIDKDIVDELSRRTGCTFLTRVDSRVRIWQRLASGRLDASVSGIPSAERERFAHFLPYMSTRNYLIIHRRHLPIAGSLEAFEKQPQLRIGVVKSFLHGDPYDRWLDGVRQQNRVDEAADIEALYRMFRQGRIDAMLSLPPAFIPMLRRYEIEADTVVLDLAPGERILGALVLSRQTVPPGSVAALDKALGEMRRDGTLLAIYTRHIGAEQARLMLRDLPH